MNITPGEEEGSYAYSVRVGGKLCLLIAVSIINFPHPWAYRWEAHRWGKFPKCSTGLSYHLILGPLCWECPHSKAYTHTKMYEYIHTVTDQGSHFRNWSLIYRVVQSLVHHNWNSHLFFHQYLHCCTLLDSCIHWTHETWLAFCRLVQYHWPVSRCQTS